MNEEINLTEQQFFDLIVKGMCDINGFKITALYEGKLFDNTLMRKFKQESILLEDYKQKVKEAIIHSFAYGSRDSRETIKLNLIKELGLE